MISAPIVIELSNFYDASGSAALDEDQRDDHHAQRHADVHGPLIQVQAKKLEREYLLHTSTPFAVRISFSTSLQTVYTKLTRR